MLKVFCILALLAIASASEIKAVQLRVTTHSFFYFLRWTSFNFVDSANHDESVGSTHSKFFWSFDHLAAFRAGTATLRLSFLDDQKHPASADASKPQDADAPKSQEAEASVLVDNSKPLALDAPASEKNIYTGFFEVQQVHCPHGAKKVCVEDVVKNDAETDVRVTAKVTCRTAEEAKEDQEKADKEHQKKSEDKGVASSSPVVLEEQQKRDDAAPTHQDALKSQAKVHEGDRSADSTTEEPHKPIVVENTSGVDASGKTHATGTHDASASATIEDANRPLM